MQKSSNGPGGLCQEAKKQPFSEEVLYKSALASLDQNEEDCRQFLRLVKNCRASGDREGTVFLSAQLRKARDAVQTVRKWISDHKAYRDVSS